MKKKITEVSNSKRKNEVYRSGQVAPKHKPIKMLPEKRALSSIIMPAGKRTCNAKLTSRDGYCQQKGVAEFSRCLHHGGEKTQEAYDVFSKSLGFEKAAKLEALIKDTLNMDNELGTAKVVYTQALEDWQRASNVRAEYLDSVPIIPKDLTSKEDKLMFQKAIALHFKILDVADGMENKSYHRVERLLRTLIEGVVKNKRITEGVKFTMDIKQVREILRMQLEIMALSCSQCPNLKNVIRLMREKSKDIIVNPSMDKESRKAMGAKAYEEQLGMVQDIGERIEKGQM